MLRSYVVAAVVFGLGASTVFAGDFSGNQGAAQSGEQSTVQASDQSSGIDLNRWASDPVYLSDTEASAIGGYFETQVKSEHITPRGLVVADKGVEVQPAAGLTFDLFDGNGFVDKISTTLAFGTA